MSPITELEQADLPAVNELLQTCFVHGHEFRYAFCEEKVRLRWAAEVLRTHTDLAASYGLITGVRSDPPTSVIGVAQWFLPSKRFPPRWYHTIRYTARFLPLFLRPTYLDRYNRLNDLYLSLFPRKCRFLYLSGLAVHPNFQNQQLGTQLVKWGQDYATRYDCLFFLHCWQSLVPYYKRLGFAAYSQGSLKGLDSVCHGLIWKPQSTREAG